MALGSAKKKAKSQGKSPGGGTHLGDQGPLRGEAVLQVDCALVAGHALQQHLQHAAQEALLGLRHRHRLQFKGKM